MSKSPIDGKALRQHAKDAAQLLKAIGNPARLTILCALVDGEHSVSELSEIADISMSAVSQHLGILRREDFVQTRRDAQTIYYSLGDHDLQDLMRCLHDMYCE